MNGKKGRVRLAALALALAAAAARPAAAQWKSVGYGVAEYDTKETLLLLAGVNATPGGAGIAPLVSLQAYHLSYDAGTSRANSFVVRPSVGLTSGFDGGSAHALIGYAFSNREDGGPVVASDNGKGVVLSGGVDLTPQANPWAFQALGSYNFGSEAFWARGRATTRVGASGPSSMRAGAEVAFLNGTGYQAVQPGVILSWQQASGSSFGIGGGAKFINNGGGTAAYFKVEGSLPLFR